MSKKLFVGSLDWNTNDQDLQAIFAGYGEVLEAKVIQDRDTGRSRGFGFVTLADPSEARRAIQELDGSTHGGRTINVKEAQEKSSGGGPRRDGPRRRNDDRKRGNRY